MKKLLALVVCVGTTVLAQNHTYSTLFQNEPAGNWLQGNANGGGQFNNCVFAAGKAYGSQTGNNGTDDSVCALASTGWGQNQVAAIQVAPVGSLGAQFDEVEVHLNTTMTSQGVYGYEINCSVNSQYAYLQIVRWDGPKGSYHFFDGRGQTCKGGDVLSAQRSGSKITAYKNGQAILSVNDSTYLNGSPGMGFFIQTPSESSTLANQAFGVSAFCATDSAATCTFAAQGPQPTVNLYWTPTTSATVIYKAQSSNCSSVTNWTLLAAVSTSTYADSAVSVGNWYCYLLAPVSNGLTGAPSQIVSVQATSSSSAGVLEPAPSIPQIQTVSGNVTN